MRKATKLLGVGAIGLALLTMPAPAFAGDRDVERSGTCSDGSRWELKLSPEDGGVEVEFEVDQDVVSDTGRNPAER